MLLIGHRGAAGLAPENTIEALHAGKAAGADMLEFDIRLTKDAIPVIIHDATSLRTHGKRLVIAEHSLYDLHQQDVMLPTLSEVLNETAPETRLNIELKDRGSAKIVIDILGRLRRPDAVQNNILLSSFSIDELRTARQYHSSIRLALLQRLNPYVFLRAKHLHLSAVGFYFRSCPAHAVTLAKKAGLFTYAYTVNKTNNAHRLERKGVDAIVTDYPDRFATR